MGKVNHHHIVDPDIRQVGLGNEPDLVQAIVLVDAHQNRLVKFLFITDKRVQQVFYGGVDELDQRDLIHAVIEPIRGGLKSKICREITEAGDGEKYDRKAQPRVRKIQQVIKPAEGDVNEVGGSDQRNNEERSTEKIPDKPAKGVIIHTASY